MFEAVRITGYLKRERWILLGLAVLLISRFAYVGLVFHHERWSITDTLFRTLAPKSLRQSGKDGMLQADAQLYRYLGREVAAGRPMDCPPRVPGAVDVVSPGYPLFLGALFRVFGSSLMTVLLAHVVLDAVTAVVLILFLRRVRGARSPVAESLFLVAFAVYAPYVTGSIRPLTECLFTLLLSISVLLYRRPGQPGAGGWRYHAASGLALGCATLTRPVTLLLPVWMAGWALLRPAGAGRLKQVAGYAVMLAAMSVCILPWTLRNTVRYGRFVLINSNTTVVTAGTDTGTSGGEVRGPARSRDTETVSLFTVVLRRLRVMLGDPGASIRLWAVKPLRLWLNLGFPRPPSTGSVITAVLQLLLLVTAGRYLYTNSTVRTAGAGMPLHLFAYTTFFHTLLFTAKIRFVVPLMPYLLLFTAAAVADWWARRARGKSN